jgi:hypothetical protein
MIKKCCVCKDIIDDMGFRHKRYCDICRIARAKISNIISQANNKAPNKIKCLDCNRMIRNISNRKLCISHKIKRHKIREKTQNYKRKFRNAFKQHSNIGIYLDPNY